MYSRVEIKMDTAHMTFASAMFPRMLTSNPLAFRRGLSDVVARWTWLRMRILKIDDYWTRRFYRIYIPFTPSHFCEHGGQSSDGGVSGFVGGVGSIKLCS